MDEWLFAAGNLELVDQLEFPEKFNIIEVLWDGYHLSNSFFYLTLLPRVTVAVRRFHDIGLGGARVVGLFLMPFALGFFGMTSSGFSSYVIILSFIGISAIYIYWLTKDSNPSTNRFGPSPKVVGHKDVFS